MSDEIKNTPMDGAVWAADYEAKRDALEAAHAYNPMDEHSSCGVGLDGAKCPSMSILLATKPKPHVPPLNRFYSAILKAAKAISWSVSFISCAAALKSAS